MRSFVIAAMLVAAGAASAAVPEKPLDEPRAGLEIVHAGDGALMAYVPSGWFLMGMNADEAERLARGLGYKSYHVIAAEEWFPRRRVWLPGYFMDKYEVTLAQWDRFSAAAGYTAKLEKTPATT